MERTYNLYCNPDDKEETEETPEEINPPKEKEKPQKPS